MASFITITKNALQLTWEKRSLWWVMIPAGLLVGANTYLAAIAQQALPETSEASVWRPLIASQELALLFIFLLVALLGQSLLRGIVVFALNQKFQDEKSTTAKRVDVSNKPWRAAGVSVIFETAYWITTLLIAATLSIPCFLAWRFNPSALPAILELGFLLLLTIGVYLHFVKELSVFYAILGDIRFRLAIDLGFRLFRRQSMNTILFFFYAALLALFFTLLIGGLIAPFGISQKDSPWQATLIGVLPFGFYFIFDQALRLIFFRAIATTPKKPISEEIALKASENPSGITPS